MPTISIKSFTSNLPDASIGDTLRFSDVDTFKTALANGASGAALASLVANKIGHVDFVKARSAGPEALSHYRVVTGDPGADALKIQLGSTGKWLTQMRPNHIVYLAKYPGMIPGTDVTDVVRAAIEENVGGAVFVWPTGSYTIRYKNLLLRTGHVHEAAIFGQTTIVAATGGSTQAAAYSNSLFSIPTNNTNVAVRGFVFSGTNDTYFAVHARNGAQKIVIEDCHCIEIGLYTTFYYVHAAFDWASSTDANRVKNLLIQRCTGVNTAAGADGNPEAWAFIDIRYTDGGVVRDCRATGYDSAVIMWGGFANEFNGARSNERKCKNILVDHCHFVGQDQGGVWGAMCYNCHITNCYLEDVHDVAYDWEGSDSCTVTNSVVKDCDNLTFGHFYLCDNVHFVGVTSIISNAEIDCHYRSYNDSGSPVSNCRIRVERCYFLTLNGGIAYSHCEGGPVHQLVFENNFCLNSRFNLTYAAGTGSGPTRFTGNELYFTATAPPEMVGTATGGALDTLIDSTRSWQLNMFRGCRVSITGGTGAGQTREIRSINTEAPWGECNNATTLHVRGNNWDVAPDATSTYRIEFTAVVLGGTNLAAGGSTDDEPINHDAYAIVCQNNTIVGLTGNNKHYARGMTLFSRTGETISGIFENNRIFRFQTAAHAQSHVINGGRTVRMYLFRNIVKCYAYTTTGNVTLGSAVIPVADSTSLYVNQEVSGTGIPAGSYITAIGLNSITISGNATATNTGVTLTFGQVPWYADGSNPYRMVFDGNYEYNGGRFGNDLGLVRTPRAVTTVDYGSIAANGSQTLTMRIFGAKTFHRVVVCAPVLEVAGFYVAGRVTADNTVTVTIRNVTGSSVDPANATITAWLEGTLT